MVYVGVFTFINMRTFYTDDGRIYPSLMVRLCDLVAPLISMLSSSMRKSNLFVLYIQTISVPRNSFSIRRVMIAPGAAIIPNEKIFSLIFVYFH